MKDIDFDELDKAVSSLLGSSDQKPATASQPTSSTPTTPVTPPATPNAPEPAKPAASTAPSVPPREPATPSVSAPAARRSGRFMDVVHPSSDMAGADKEANSQPLAGSGRKLQPINRDVKPEPVEPKEEAKKAEQPIPQKLSVVPEADPKTLVSTPDTDDTKWPDPLDVQPPQSADTSTETKTEETDASKTDSASPFLTDAKVEKRPLGAYADQPKSEAAPTDEKAPDKPNASDSSFDTLGSALLPGNDSQIPATPAAPNNDDMPPELDQKVVEIEATERGETTQPDADKEAGQKSEASDLAEASTPSNPPVNVASMSIPQQYKSTERPAKEADRPVFDTKDYHAPIQTTDHKKSGMGQWILLGVLLLVAVGGAVYWLLYLH